MYLMQATLSWCTILDIYVNVLYVGLGIRFYRLGWSHCLRTMECPIYFGCGKMETSVGI